MNIIHYDLFAGIGGFSYALEQVFYGHEIKHIFCEWEAFPTAVLKKHWPDGTFYGDIADLVADTDLLRERNGLGTIQKADGEISERHDYAELSNSNSKHEITILTGGFPCQPFSHAGRRKGTADDRYLWPSMFEVIRNVRPDWVIAENVRGFVTWNEGMVLERTCTDLESEGYEVQPFIIPACAVQAPHQRERVWIIAHNRSAGLEEARSSEQTTRSGRNHTQSTTDPRQQLREQGSGEGLETNTSEWSASSEANQREREYTWADDWQEVAFATCHDGVDDGLSERMVRLPDGSEISPAKWRKESLKAYGNAIVPQVAEQIFRAIKTTL